MIEVLNDLQDFCKKCPYAHLVLKERLGSGHPVYTCEFMRMCNRVYNDSIRMKEQVESEEV